MCDPVDDEYQNYLSKLHGTLEILAANAQEQCDVMGAYNAPWELRQDGADFIDAVLSLNKGQLDEHSAGKLRALRETLVALPGAAVTPGGNDMTTAEGCLVAFGDPAWAAVRTDAASCLMLVDDPFA